MRDPGDSGPQTTMQQSMQSNLAGNNTPVMYVNAMPVLGMTGN